MTIKEITVLKAINLRRAAGGQPQTAQEIADYLHANVDDVHNRLVELKARKLVSDIKRGERREWQRWGK